MSLPLSDELPETATMNVMRLRPWLAMALSLLVVAGCSKGEKLFVGGKPAPKVYKQYVSLSPGATEVGSLIFSRIPLGRTASCDIPSNVKSLPVVTTGVKPNYEKIVSLKPDVVLYDPDLSSDADIAKFKELHIDAISLGGATLDEYCDSIYNFGKMTMLEMAGSGYVDKIIRERSIAAASAPKPPVTMAFLMPRSPGTEHMIAGTDGFIADVTKGDGSIPVGPKGKLFVTLNVESFMQMDPEVIVVSGADTGPVLTDPRLSNLRAVRNRHVYTIEQNLMLRKGAYVDQFVKRVAELALVSRKKAAGTN